MIKPYYSDDQRDTAATNIRDLFVQLNVKHSQMFPMPVGNRSENVKVKQCYETFIDLEHQCKLEALQIEQPVSSIAAQAHQDNEITENIIPRRLEENMSEKDQQSSSSMLTMWYYGKAICKMVWSLVSWVCSGTCLLCVGLGSCFEYVLENLMVLFRFLWKILMGLIDCIIDCECRKIRNICIIIILFLFALLSFLKHNESELNDFS